MPTRSASAVPAATPDTNGGGRHAWRILVVAVALAALFHWFANARVVATWLGAIGQGNQESTQVRVVRTLC